MLQCLILIQRLILRNIMLQCLTSFFMLAESIVRYVRKNFPASLLINIYHSPHNHDLTFDQYIIKLKHILERSLVLKGRFWSTKLILILMLPLVSCVKVEKGPSIIPNYNPRLDLTDPSLTPYLEEAEFILQYSSGVDTIRFIDDSEQEGLDENIQGICLLPKRVILLRRSSWERATDEWRMALLIHELGHCDFLRVHTESEECDGNIMHPNTLCTYEAFISKSDEHIRKEIKR